MFAFYLPILIGIFATGKKLHILCIFKVLFIQDANAEMRCFNGLSVKLRTVSISIYDPVWYIHKCKMIRIKQDIIIVFMFKDFRVGIAFVFQHVQLRILKIVLIDRVYNKVTVIRQINIVIKAGHAAGNRINSIPVFIVLFRIQTDNLVIICQYDRITADEYLIIINITFI